MASKTPYLGLGYFDYRDRLDASMSVRIEAERFNLIDRQLYGLFSIFGDGIVSGMQAVIRTSSVTGERIIEIQPGTVIVRGRAYITDVPVEIPDSGLSGQYYIYLVDSEINQGERQLGFGFDKSALSNIGVRLCRVFAPSGDVSSIDNSVRQEINFKNIAQQQIASHRHSGSPTRIDLLREVKNALPGARVQSFDASKVSSGVVPQARIPRLNHDELKNRGVLSHAALESLAMQISNFSRVLMSEVASRNIMQQSMLLRRTYPLSRDESVNMVTFIPGISPSTMLDLDNTTAFFSPESGCISGRPQPAGRVVQIFYRSPQALQSAFQSENMTFFNSAYVLASSISGGGQVQFKDSFENATGLDTPIPGFTYGTEVKTDNIKVVSNGTSVSDGSFSAKIVSGKFEKSVYKRAVFQNQNWNPFNRLYMDVKCVSDSHPIVYVYFTSQEGGDIVSSERFFLLEENEITSGPSGGFKTVELNIETYARGEVKEIIFEVDSAAVDFEFFVDNISTASVQSDNIVFSNYGFVKYRYVSSSLVFLNGIIFDAQTPNSTRVQVRYRAGSTLSELETAEYSDPIASGDYIGASCFYIEVEVRLFTNNARNDTPVFSGMELILNAPGGTPRYEFDTANDWSKGSGVAIDINPDEGGYLSIQSPLETGDIIFSHANIVQQSRLIGDSYTPRRAWLGSNLPIAPAAAMASLDGPSPSVLDGPSRVIRLPNRHIIVSDTYNDRVLVLDQEGSLIKGFGGSYFKESQQGNVPLSAVFNPNTAILQIVFSFDMPESVNTDFIVLRIGNAIIRLSARDERVTGGYPSNVLAIRLAPDRVNIIVSRDPTQVFKVKMENALFGTTFGFNKDSAVWIYNHGVDGLNVFVGNFYFVPHISHPVCAVSSASGDIYVANSSQFFDRIKAGIRDDVDEFFIVADGAGSTFYVTVAIGDELAAQNPRVTFVQDETAAIRDGFPPETLVFYDQNDNILENSSGTGSGVASVVQISQAVAQITIIPNADQAGTTFFGKIKVRITVGSEGNRTEVRESPFLIEKRITVLQSATQAGVSPGPSVPSFVKINGETGSLINSFGSIDTFGFNDFTLGGIALREEENRVAIAGSVKTLSDTEGAPIPDVDPTTFLGQAALAMNLRTGYMYELSTEDFSVIRRYRSPDGLYCSDVEAYSNGQYLIAESAILSARGRIIVYDSNNNITFQFNSGSFGMINKVTPTNDDTFIIST